MEKILAAVCAIMIIVPAVALERGHLNRRSLQKQKLLNLRTKESES